jgi:hypothetical protein
VKAGKGGGGDKDGKKKNAFGTQIEFVLLKNLNSVGPTFTLQTFKGPGKLFSTQRTDTHSVTIGFARAQPGRGGQARSEAEKQNQKQQLDSLKNNLRLFQQRLP